jgi:RNA polymerase sigma-70 factor (ECF subfamily)
MNLARSTGINWSNAPGHPRRGRIAIGPATDRSIVDRARHGDLDAFEQLVRARMETVYRLTHAIVNDPADAADAAQETFVAAWRQIRSLRDSARFDAWLTRIAVNAARMTLRARGRRRVREIPASAATGRAADATGTTDAWRATDEPVRPDDGARLAAALDHLTADQRALLALHHLDGRSVADIAAVLAIPSGTVRSRLFTARRALDAALAAEDDR